MLCATLYGIRTSVAHARAHELLDLVELSRDADRKVDTYSGGMRRRLEIACGLINRPRLLFLDAAGFLALVVISLGSAWGVLEAIDAKGRKSFLTVYGLESLPALLLVAVSTSYLSLMLDLMVIYTIIILPSLYLLGRLVSRRDVMKGHEYNHRWLTTFWVMSTFIAVAGMFGVITLL